MPIPTLKKEAYTPADVLHALLKAAGADLVLVGGQALAYWMGYYGIRTPGNRQAISRDVDFLVLNAGDRSVVKRMAAALKGGTAEYPPEQALTALVGQAYKRVGEDEYLNVDLICKMVGLVAATVRESALEVALDGTPFRVMHPMDVLTSRLHNLYELEEKQTALGEAQLCAAMEVMRAAQREHATRQSVEGRSPLLGWAKAIERLARDDAGRKVAERHGIHVADAIEVEAIGSPAYLAHKLPRLERMVSAERWEVLERLLPQPPMAPGA